MTFDIDYDLIEELADEWRDEQIQEIVSILEYAGLEAVKEARLKGNYTDRTGNLRSSIGFVVVDDGRIVSSNFEVVPPKRKAKGSDGGMTGKKNAQSFALELSKEYSKGIALIIVAGMNYAIYVENGHYIKVGNSVRRTRPYDVLVSGELVADKMVPEMLNAIGIKI